MPLSTIWRLYKAFSRCEMQVDGARVIRKCCYYLLPWLWLLVFFTYLDRSNLSFAAFQFKQDVHLSNTIYGLGASERQIKYLTDIVLALA